MPKSFILPFTSLEGELMKRLIEGTNGTEDSTENGNDGNDAKKARLRKLRPPSQNKTKYTCPGCQVNLWGRPNLQIRCVPCDADYEQQGSAHSDL